MSDEMCDRDELRAPRRKAVVLLSAGLDSTVNLYRARSEYAIPCVLTFNYGQRAAHQEVERSAVLCAELKLHHQVVELPWMKRIGQSALTTESLAVPGRSQVDLEGTNASVASAKAVWVPNRNGVFLNIAAAYAEHFGAEVIIPGFNTEEAATFPDNSEEFLKTIDRSLAFSTAQHVRTHCYTTKMNKAEIVALGRDLGVPFQQLWPCYQAGPELCGECESCQRFERAMNSAGLSIARSQASWERQ